MKPNEKHLEFLQSNISRMNQCSFQMKGWAITVASALVALFASKNTRANPGNIIYLYTAIASTALFWCVDALYLSKERKFIGIYNDLIGISNGKKQKAVAISEFAMPLNEYKSWKYCMFSAMLSFSELLLYGIIIVGLIVLIRII